MPGGPRGARPVAGLSHLLPGGGGQRLLQELPEPRVRGGGRGGAEHQGDGEQGQGALEAARQHLAGGSGAAGGGGRRWRLRCGSAPALGISSPPAAFINPSPDVKAGAPPSPHAAGGGSLGQGENGAGDAPLCPAPAKPPRFPPSSPLLWPPPAPVPITALPEPPPLAKAPRPGAGSCPVGGETAPESGERQRIPLKAIASDCSRGWGVLRCPWGSFLHHLLLWVSPALVHSQTPSRGQLRGQRENPGSGSRLLPGSAAPGSDDKSALGSGRAGPWLSLRGPLAPSQGRWTSWSRGMHLSHWDGQSPPLLQPLPVTWLVPTKGKAASNPRRISLLSCLPAGRSRAGCARKGLCCQKSGIRTSPISIFS